MQQPASWTPPAVLEGFCATFMWRCAHHVGSQYLRLHYSEVDDLCQWVLDSREACQKGATLEDLIKRDVTSTNAKKEHGSKDVPAVINITDQDQAKVSVLSSTSLKKIYVMEAEEKGKIITGLPSQALDDRN